MNLTQTDATVVAGYASVSVVPRSSLGNVVTVDQVCQRCRGHKHTHNTHSTHNTQVAEADFDGNMDLLAKWLGDAKTQVRRFLEDPILTGKFN